MAIMALDRHQRGSRFVGYNLPPGLTVDPATGEISGIPAEPGTWTYTVCETAILRWPWSWLRRLRVTRGGC